MAKWRPMRTAPKDGTSVLLLVDGKVIEGSFYDEVCGNGERYGPGKWDVVSLPSHGCGCCSTSDPEPSGWLPLPPQVGKDRANG